MMTGELRRFDIWLAIKYWGSQDLGSKSYIKKIYKSKEYSHGYGMAMNLVSCWLADFANHGGLPEYEELDKEWNKVLSKLGKKEE